MRILIADDHPINLRLLRAQLESEGHSVVEAANGAEALAILNREQVDVIVSDILMPVMDGYRLCYEVRHSPRLRDLPFIIYTASYVSPSDEKLSLDLGADAYLRKPASVPELARTIGEAVAGPRRRPVANVDTDDVLKQYSELLVQKLEEKNAELTQAVNELTLKSTAVETAADAILITDTDGVILSVNPAFTTTTGYTPEDAIGKTPRILSSGKHEPGFYRDFWETIRSGRMWRGEFINRRKDGSLYYDEHTIAPVRNADGAITHFVGIMHDITERKRAEEQLRDAHVQLRELLEHSPAVLYALKVDGDTITPRLASENITRLLGFDVAETLSMEWWRERLHPQDRERAEASITETLTAGASRTEYRLRHQDGTYRWVEDNRRLVREAAGGTTELVGVWTDITDRRRAQEGLKESERRFHEVLNNLQMIAMMIDRSARVTYCNDYFLQLTGWQSEDVIGCNWFERFVPPEDVERLRAAFHALLENSPDIRHFTNEILTRTGERRLMQWNNSILRSPAGEVIGTASIGEDITARTLAERELRRSEEKLRIIIRASNDAIGEWDLNTGEVFWSDHGSSMLGHTKATLPATIESLIHPDDLSAFQRAIDENAEKGEPYQVRLRLCHSDGSYIPVLARGQLQRETGRFLAAFTDLSIVERAEQQIHEQAALIDQAREGMIVSDLANRITFWSRGAERLYGWPASEALGLRLDALLHIDAAAFANAVRSTLADGAWTGEVEKTTAIGNRVTIDSSWTLLRDERGRPKSIFSIDTNITERKSLEKQFYRAQRLESLGTLAGGVAHDLNNLLMPILMGVTILKRFEPQERSLQAINNIERSVKRGTDLVKQVLLFARGVEGERISLDLNKIVSEVEAIAESTFPKNITITAALPATLPNVVGDTTQLNQVLLNLCVNARDAMPGGGQITIAAAEAEIDQQYAVMHGGTIAGRYVVVEVADTGTGMPKEVMEHIFEPFFTTKDLSKGTGLGLSTVQGIVRSHGGFIRVSSEIGRGSSFRVYLPAETTATETSTAQEAEALPRGNGETILVVDDEAAILSITRQTLEVFGYSVLTAEDGAQAIGLYAKDHAKIAVVLTDMMMPIIDGAALIAALRRINPDVPVIAVSGHAEGDQTTRAMKAGATEYLSKPYSAEVMLRALCTVLSGTRVPDA